MKKRGKKGRGRKRKVWEENGRQRKKKDTGRGKGSKREENRKGGWGRKPATLYIPETFHLYKQIYLFIANRIFFHFEKIKRIIEV